MNQKQVLPADYLKPCIRYFRLLKNDTFINPDSYTKNKAN